jgi:hypothetical protein
MIDKYTKAVLTVIAVCLCLITVQNLNIVPTAQASGTDIHKIAICDLRGNCARIHDGALDTL